MTMPSDTATTTLASWLLAQIAEDKSQAERAAKSYGTFSPGRRWTWESCASLGYAPGYAELRSENGTTFGQVPYHRAHHITTHDPARVLADCAAKRRIVELHEGHLSPAHRVAYGREGICRGCGYLSPCPTLRALVAPYADHDDFREEWRG